MSKEKSVLSRAFSITEKESHTDVRTPRWFFDKLHEQFDFTLDPCDSREKPGWLGIPAYNLDSKDGLLEPWTERVFVNPPWDEIKPWIFKAEIELELKNSKFIVFLVPSRTETAWFHHLLNSKFLMNHIYLKSRMQFDDMENSYVIGISLFTLWRGI